MPAKPKAKKNAFKSKARRPFNKRRKFKKTSETMVNRMPRASHTVIAPHYYTTLESSFYGSVGATGGTDSGQFVYNTNQAEFPFNPSVGNAFTGMNGAVLAPGTNSLATLNPNGLAKLFALYKSYRVYKYWTSVTCTPVQNADIIGLSAVPCTGDALAGLIGLSQQEIMSLAYSKAVMCSANNVVDKNRVSSSMMPRTLLGLTKLQYKDESSSSGQSGSAPDLATNIVVTYNTLDGTDLGNKLFFEVKLRLWLEFFDPVSDLGID